MTDINDIDVRLLDGSLLLIFLGLMRHRKATAVAAEMGLTQPAISHALKRLRTLYGDPLFLRNAQGLEPTALARELEPKILAAVSMLSASLKTHSEFDPRTSEVTLRIAGFDYELATLVPKVIAYASDLAPNISLRSLTVSSDAALESLAKGQVDLAIGFFETLPGDGSTGQFMSETLYTEEYVVTGSADHPIFQNELTLERYAQAPHLLVTPTGVVRGLVDYALDRHGVSRNIRSTVPLFFPALAVLAKSNLIATLPRQVAETNADRFGLRFAPLPLQVATFPVRAVWHQRDANSAARAWLVDLARKFCAA